jgi:hypothetical protein
MFSRAKSSASGLSPNNRAAREKKTGCARLFSRRPSPAPFSKELAAQAAEDFVSLPARLKKSSVAAPAAPPPLEKEAYAGARAKAPFSAENFFAYFLNICLEYFAKIRII